MRSLRAQIEADFQSASFLAKLKEIKVRLFKKLACHFLTNVKHIANLDLVVRFSQMVERAQECKKNGTFIEPIPRQKKRQPRKKNVDAADVTIEEQGRQPSNERCRIMVAYHGTNPKNCESISKVGLIVPGVADGKDCQIVHGCAMGHGIYLTTSVGTALGYTGIIEGPCVFVCLALAEPGTIVQELGNTIVIKRQEYVLPVAVCHVTPSNQLVSAPPLPAYNLPVWPTFPPASVFPLPPPPPAPTKKKRAPRKRKMPPSNDSGAHPPAPKKTKS